MTRLILLLMAITVVPTAVLAGDEMAAEKIVPQALAEFVSPADSLPHLRFLADQKVTLNDRCPVRKVKLNPMMGASYVNGQPVGFC